MISTQAMIVRSAVFNQLLWRFNEAWLLLAQRCMNSFLQLIFTSQDTLIARSAVLNKWQFDKTF